MEVVALKITTSYLFLVEYKMCPQIQWTWWTLHNITINFGLNLMTFTHNVWDLLCVFIKNFYIWLYDLLLFFIVHYSISDCSLFRLFSVSKFFIVSCLYCLFLLMCITSIRLIYSLVKFIVNRFIVNFLFVIISQLSKFFYLVIDY